MIKVDNLSFTWTDKPVFTGVILRSIKSCQFVRRRENQVVNCRLLAQNFNFLVLDEPTTYLDPLSQRLILESLKEYRGAMLIVSHNQSLSMNYQLTKSFIYPKIELKLN